MSLEMKAVELLDKFEDLAVQYTPEVIDSAIGVVRMNGIGAAISAVVGVVAGVVLAIICIKAVTFFNSKDQEYQSYTEGWVVGAAFTSIAGVATCTILVSIGICSLSDIWNWVAIFNPKLALAHKLLGF